MTASRNRRVILLALLLAAASAAVAYALLVSRPAASTALLAAPPVSGVPVLTAARAIAAGETLTAADVEVVYVPAEAKGTRVLTRAAQAVGETALVAIPQGEQILAGSVGDDLAKVPETYAKNVPVGMRAVSIESAEAIGVGGLVQPGDRVDVIAAMELKPVRQTLRLEDALANEQPDGDPFPMAELIVQDVEVLAIGQALDPSAPAAPEKSTQAEESAGQPGGPAVRPEAASVTLLVNPTQALRLLLAVEAEANFRLLLRAPGDTTVTELPPALITAGPVAMEPFQLVGANLAAQDLVITEARFRDTSVPAGGTLEFEVTVRNASPRRISAGQDGAPPGHVFPVDDTWRSIVEDAAAGVYSVGVTAESAEPQTYPWRWDLGEDLAPGATTTIRGGIQVPNESGMQRWWFGTMLQPGTVLEDGVAPVEITIEPVTSVVVTAAAAEVREAPWPNAASTLTLARGDRVDVLHYEDGWFLVRSGEKDGWVAETFVMNTALPEAAAIAPEAEAPVVGTPVAGTPAAGGSDE
jgi:pilus assembly protein CpaB